MMLAGQEVEKLDEFFLNDMQVEADYPHRVSEYCLSPS